MTAGDGTPEALQPLLRGWLRRAAQHPAAPDWMLRGSLITRALCGTGRLPADVDYLVAGPYAPERLQPWIAEIARLPDDRTRLILLKTEAIWAETDFPGLRAHLTGTGPDGATATFQVDFAFGDPLAQAPVSLVLPGVGAVRACAAETLWAWKLHGLVEFGPGRWRAKDLYDLFLLQTHVQLDRAALGLTVPLAFSSRRTSLNDLRDLLERETWGSSAGNRRKWRVFRERARVKAEFLDVRETVRALVREIVGTTLYGRSAPSLPGEDSGPCS